jgi:uncharacterized FlgJ-related protein
MMKIRTIVIAILIGIAPLITQAHGHEDDQREFAHKIYECVHHLYTKHPDKYPLAQQIPVDLIIAQAAHESAWGKSRFAVEGNNLFGIRTWDLKSVPHLKAKGNPDAKWGVRVYKSWCSCVINYIDILNRHPAYESFRAEREYQIDINYMSGINLASHLTAWSELGVVYTEKLRNIMAHLYKEGFFLQFPVEFN